MLKLKSSSGHITRLSLGTVRRCDRFTPIFAEDILKIGPEGWAVTGSTFDWCTHHHDCADAFSAHQHAWRNMLLAVAGFSLFTLLFACSDYLWLSLFALAMTGACDSISVVIRQTILQIYPPENMRGRVAAVNGMFVSVVMNWGHLRSGLAAKYLGPVDLQQFLAVA